VVTDAGRRFGSALAGSMGSIADFVPTHSPGESPRRDPAENVRGKAVLSAKVPFPPRYFVASVLLLAALTGLYAVSVARRTQQELSRQLEAKGLALADTIETSSRNAILGNQLMEEMIAQRLLDNARLVDQLLLSRPFDAEWLGEIRAMNRLSRIELLDRDGRPYTPPPRRPPGMMGMMMQRPPSDVGPDQHRAMMMYMWGRRWSAPSPEGGVPPLIRDKKFWQGSEFGVAVGARSFPGIIAVHADAAYVLNFSREIGVQHQVEEMGRQPGIDSIALLDRDLTVVAHSRPERVGQRESAAGLVEALTSGRTIARLVRREGREPVYEIVKPLFLAKDRPGILRIALSTASMDRVWRRDRLVAVILGLTILALGSLGMAAIFYTQHRHLAEMKALEAEMERRERLSALGNMAAAVAHEIRNPLNAVSMGLQRLRGEFHPPEAEEYRALLDVVQGEVRRLNSIVEEFLSLARPLSLRPEPIGASALVDEVLLLCDGEARAAGITTDRDVSPDLPPLQADRDRIKQVLLNLVLNAIQAMPEGGKLTLGASVSGGAFIVEVADTGGGIAPEVLPRLFEPYVTTKARGLGLGLAIARRIVEAHGGTIEAANRPEGGSRFRVTLPLLHSQGARK
jgi:two-component system sensor histidine kinase HydH